MKQMTEASRPHRLFVHGQWIETGSSMPVINPATGMEFARVHTMEQPQIDAALEAAQSALSQWRATMPRDRGTVLHRAADHLQQQQDMVARTITRENGKPLAQSVGEVAMAVDHLRWFAEEGRRIYGRVIPAQATGKRHFTVKTAIGVVGAISPWNFPLVLAVRKVAPALAAGCPVLLKPATQTPLSAIALAEALETAGVPPGVFQLVIGEPERIADSFLSSDLCRKVTFTGSTRVGRELIRKAAPHIKPLSLELGGHAPVLVFDDCDLDVAVRETMIAKFRNTGQSCIAANRIYVQHSIYAAFVERFVDAVRALTVGEGFEPGVDVGPMISERALDGALAQIADAERCRGHVLTGGARLPGQGFFLEPTVIEGVSDDALCMREETFAPIAPITGFATEQEAIARANATPYGLSAYAMTRDMARMFRLSEQLEAGTLGVNDGAPATSQSPFGGVKQSGWGRELGAEGIEAFLETKHVSIGGI